MSYECLDLDNSEEQQNLKDLLVAWGFGQLFQHFKNCLLDINSLPLLTDRDLERLFPVAEMGILLVFRQKLQQWKTLNFRGVVNSVESPCQESKSGNQIPANNEEFDLKRYLADNGRNIQDEYLKNNNVLLDCLRDKIITDSVQFYLNRKIFMKQYHFERITEQIVKIFTTERKETYYCNTDTSFPTGRLYNTYRNSASNLRKHGLFPREKKTKRAKLSSEIELENESDPSTEDNEDLVWLQVYSCPFDIVVEKWKKTINIRIPHSSKKSIKQILEIWPKYINSNGAQLIDIDFNHLHPGKGSLLYNKWEQFVSQVIPILKTSIKDKHTLNQITCFDFSDPNIDKDSRDILVFQSLHAILPPTGQVKHKVNKKLWKFSILDSQNSFIRTEYSFAAIEETRKEKQLDYYNYNLNLQPNTFIIKHNNTTCYYAVYDSVIYKFDHLLQAICTCFKIHYVFNLKYQNECKIIWEFIQTYFFEIEGNYNSTSLSTLIGKLKKT